MDWRSDSSYGIYATRVSAQGAVLDPAGIVVSTAGSEQKYPAVAFDGANFLAVWVDDRDSNYDVFAARVTPQGTVLDPSGIAVSTAQYDQNYTAVAFDGANFLVAWSDDWRSNPNSDIHAARVTPQGTVLDPQAILVSGATGRQEFTAVGFDGVNSLVCWSDGRSGPARDIYAARVTPAGTVLDPSGFIVSAAANGQDYPCVAFDGANSLVAWCDYRSSGYGDVYAARVTPQGAVLDPQGILATLAIGWQEYPAVAFDGVNYLVSWTNGRSDSTHDVYAARVASAGAVLDSMGIAVSTAPGWQSDPAIAFDGTNYLVTWMDYRNGSYGDIYAARVTPAGAVLDTSGIPVTTDTDEQMFPTIAFGGTNFLVTWMDARSGTTYDTYAARVTPAGTVLDPAGILVSAAADYQSYPAVACDGVNYLVTWMDYRGGTAYDIYAARVTPGGSVLDPAGISVSTATDDQLYPAVAFDGTDFLVSWTDERSGWQGDIYAARVTPAGTVLDPSGIAVSTGEGEELYPDIVFDGVNFLVAWQDSRSGSTFDIYGARVTPAGVVFDSGPVVRQEGDQVGPALARGTGNQLFLAYQGWAGTVGAKTYNTDRIWGKMDPRPGVEERDKCDVRRVKGGATVIRGVLRLAIDECRVSNAELLDVVGRRVMELRLGANDVSHLAPGVYFVRAESRELSAVSCHKVVVQR